MLILSVGKNLIRVAIQNQYKIKYLGQDLRDKIKVTVIRNIL